MIYYTGNPCPGSRPWTPCEDDDPCEEIGECQSNPNLTCIANECAKCRAVWYDENGDETQCDGK